MLLCERENEVPQGGYAMSALVLLPGEGKVVQIGGLGVVFKLFGTDTGGQFAVVEHPLAPGTLGGPPHVHHREDEASYVLEGEIMAQVGDRLIQAPRGHWPSSQRVSLIPSGTRARLQPASWRSSHRRALRSTLRNWPNWSPLALRLISP